MVSGRQEVGLLVPNTQRLLVSVLFQQKRTDTNNPDTNNPLIREAIELHLEGLEEDGLPLPEPSSRVGYVVVNA